MCECVQTSVTCDKIVNSEQCNPSGLASLLLQCVWVKGDSVSSCVPVQESCGGITNKDVCKTDNVISTEESQSGCFWMDGRDGGEGNCVDRV
jgi:hypothetical protein